MPSLGDHEGSPRRLRLNRHDAGGWGPVQADSFLRFSRPRGGESRSRWRGRVLRDAGKRGRKDKELLERLLRLVRHGDSQRRGEPSPSFWWWRLWTRRAERSGAWRKTSIAWRPFAEFPVRNRACLPRSIHTEWRRFETIEHSGADQRTGAWELKRQQRLEWRRRDCGGRLRFGT